MGLCWHAHGAVQTDSNRDTPAFEEDKAIALQNAAYNFCPNENLVIANADGCMMVFVCISVEHGHVPHSNVELFACAHLHM